MQLCLESLKPVAVVKLGRQEHRALQVQKALQEPTVLEELVELVEPLPPEVVARPS